MKLCHFKIALSLILVSNISLVAQKSIATDAETPGVHSQSIYDELVQEAVMHYSSRRYEAAISAFQKAFGIQPEPELVYNIARSYERMAQTEDALEWYQKFLDTPGTTGELRTRALNNMTALRKELAARDTAQQADPLDQRTADPKTDKTDANSKKANSTEGDDKAHAAMADTAGDGSVDLHTARMKRRLRIVGWLSVGVGTALIAAGGTFGILANKSRSDFDAAGDSPDRVGYRDDLKQRALMSDIFFSGGAAVTAVGISLLIVYALKNRSSDDVSSRARMNLHRNRSVPAVRLTPSVLVGDGVFAGGFVGQF